MNEFEQKSTGVELKQSQAGLWTIGIFSAISLAFFGFSLYAVFVIQEGQANISDYILIFFTALMIVASGVSFFLARYGRLMAGVWLLVAIDLVIPPILVTLLLKDVYPTAIAYLAILAIMLAFLVFPRASRWQLLPVTILATLSILVIEAWNPAFRLTSSTNLPDFIVVVEILAGSITFLLFMVYLWRSGRLRNRIMALLVVVLAPMLVVYSYISVRAQQQDLEDALLERAKAAAITEATFAGKSLEDAIDGGLLTAEDVFDQNYVKFFEFDPNKYPEIKDDPRIYDKYHTAYDAYTDEHWQAMFDSYLTGPDMLYAVVSDINGYVPTHNTVFSTGDGDPATDRTKRIFNDTIGLTAARNTEPTLQQIYLQSGTGATLWDISAPIYVNGQHWGGVRIGVQLAQNQERVQAATLRAVVTSSILLAIVVAFAWLVGNYITNPIERLTKASQEAASGNLGTRIDIPGRDEITILANAFNSMTAQLREFIDTLEGRVAARTRDLAIVAEVGTATATILETERLLQEVVDLTKERFNLYHSHIYLLDEAGENLVLASGAGEPGRQMKAQGLFIPLDREQSLVARSARERQGVTVNDVTEAPDFLPNPLLPDTRSELAVPMIVGGKLIGVFDVQSDQVGRFTDSDISIQTTLAAQVATSIQNVRSFEQAKSQADLESLASAIGQKIQRTTSMEEAMQTAIREVGLALGATRVSANIHSSRTSEQSKESVE